MRLLLIPVLVGGLLGGLVVPASAEISSTAPQESDQADLVALINDYRGANGLGPVVLNDALTAAASWMATDMATKNYFSHTSSDGRSPQQRMAAFGYPADALYTGETLAAGQVSAAEVIASWKASPAHNAILLSANFDAIGVGYAYNATSMYKSYWTADFGGPGGNVGPPPPPQSTVYLPNITKTLGGPTGWVTPFYVQNAGTIPTDLEVTFFRFADGSRVAQRTVSALAPGASYSDNPNSDADLPDNTQFSVVVKSFGSPAVAAVNQTQTTAAGALEALSYSGFNGGATTVYVPNVTRRFYGYDVPLIVQNLGTAFASVTATFTSFDGTQVVSIPLTVGAGHSGVIDPDYTTGLTDLTQYAVKLVSSQPIGVVANAHNEVIGPVAFSHNGLAAGAASIYAPYATKSASSFSPVVVQNVGAAPATATLTFTPLGGGTTQTFTSANIPAGRAQAFDVRFANGVALPGLPQCGGTSSATCLGNGDYSLVITTGGLVAAVVLPNSNTTAAGYAAAVAPTSKVVLPVVQRNAAGWNALIYLQSVTASSATLSYYTIGTGTLATTQTVSLTGGTGVKIDPATVTGLTDGLQYSMVITGNGTLTAIVDEINPAPGDGTMIYEGFAQ